MSEATTEERLRLFECLFACLTFDLAVDGRICQATADFMRLLGEPRIHIVEAVMVLQAALKARDQSPLSEEAQALYDASQHLKGGEPR